MSIEEEREYLYRLAPGEPSGPRYGNTGFKVGDCAGPPQYARITVEVEGHRALIIPNLSVEFIALFRELDVSSWAYDPMIHSNPVSIPMSPPICLEVRGTATPANDLPYRPIYMFDMEKGK